MFKEHTQIALFWEFFSVFYQAYPLQKWNTAWAWLFSVAFPEAFITVVDNTQRLVWRAAEQTWALVEICFVNLDPKLISPPGLLCFGFL